MQEERQKFCPLLPLAKLLYFMQCKQQVEFFEILWIFLRYIFVVELKMYLCHEKEITWGMKVWSAIRL